jgi:hypothetical protein
MAGRLSIHIADDDGVSTGELEVVESFDLAAVLEESWGRLAAGYAAAIVNDWAAPQLMRPGPAQADIFHQDAPGALERPQ